LTPKACFRTPVLRRAFFIAKNNMSEQRKKQKIKKRKVTSNLKTMADFRLFAQKMSVVISALAS